MAQQTPTKPLCENRGIQCPGCGCRHFEVLYTRAALGGRILRRRQCRYCRRRVTTYETLG